MSRFAETEIALLGRLHALKAVTSASINIVDVAAPLYAAGFTKDEIAAVIDALECQSAW